MCYWRVSVSPCLAWYLLAFHLCSSLCLPSRVLAFVIRTQVITTCTVRSSCSSPLSPFNVVSPVLIRPPTHFPTCLRAVCLPVCLPGCLLFSLSTCLPVCLPACLLVCAIKPTSWRSSHTFLSALTPHIAHMSQPPPARLAQTIGPSSVNQLPTQRLSRPHCRQSSGGNQNSQ